MQVVRGEDIEKNKKIVVGYPRSGNHWLKYCIENALNIPIGFCHANGVNVWNYISNDNSLRLVMIVRNYKECVIRHVCSSNKFNFFNIILSEMSGVTPVEVKKKNKTDYVALLNLFNNYAHEKILIYYEDLITEPEKELYRLAEFFKVEDHNIKEFMNDFKKHKRKSLRITAGETQKPETNGNALIHHSNKISKPRRIELDNHLIENFSDLFEKYLKRYKEDE